MIFNKKQLQVVPSFDLSKVKSREQVLELARYHTFAEPVQRFGWTLEQFAMLPADGTLTGVVLQKYIDGMYENPQFSVYAGYTKNGTMEIGFSRTDFPVQVLSNARFGFFLPRKQVKSPFDLPSYDELTRIRSITGTVAEYLHTLKPTWSFIVDDSSSTTKQVAIVKER